MLLRLQRFLLPLGCLGLMLTHLAAATTNDAPPALDPAFTASFSALRQSTGFIEQPLDDVCSDWQPRLQLWVGVKATEGKKQTLHFVQLTTLPPPTVTNGHPWQPAQRTNAWSWSSGTNKDAKPKKAEFSSALYPVRVRVFDATGRALKEGETPMAWGNTNGLLEMCRLSLALVPRDAATNANPLAKLAEADHDQFMRTMGSGFLWMVHMFGDLQTVPSVADVWKQAQCAIRMPGAWTMVKGLFTGFTINLSPRLRDIAPAPGANNYRLPLDLRSSDEQLANVEIIVGPARGAEMLLAGIRSVRAVHPDKPQREFLAQVLATGTCPESK